MIGGGRIIRTAGAAARFALAPARFVADRIAMRSAGPLDSLAPGEGAIVDVDGEKIAAYREPDGTVHALSPICTHLRCVVSFDAEHGEWSCPCHGSRFAVDGTVLKGPASRSLDERPVDRAAP